MLEIIGFILHLIVIISFITDIIVRLSYKRELNKLIEQMKNR